MDERPPDKKTEWQRCWPVTVFFVGQLVLWLALLASTSSPTASRWIPVLRWALSLAILVTILVMVTWGSVRSRFESRFELLGTVGMLLALLSDELGYKACYRIFGAIAIVGFVGWMIQKKLDSPDQELQQLTRKPGSPADANAESVWELRRLARRVALVEQLAAPEGPNESARQLLDTTGNTATEYFDQTLMALQQFAQRATNDDERASAMALLATARGFEGRIQDHG